MEVVFGNGGREITGPIVDGVCVRQSFIARESVLKCIDIVFATYKRRNTGTMIVSIVEQQENNIIAHCRASVSDFADHKYVRFGFNVPLIMGKTYEVRLSTLNCRSGSAVTAKYDKLPNQDHLHVGSTLLRSCQLDLKFLYASDTVTGEVGIIGDNDNLVESAKIREISQLEDCTNKNPIKGLVSIIIPHYNCHDLLIYCLASIVRQSYNGIEVIVVDDGSDDIGRVQAICDSYSPLIGIKLAILRRNNGAPKARNEGYKYASGEYLLFLDADCELYPQSIRRFVTSLIDNPSCAFSYGGFNWGNIEFPPVKWDLEKLRQRNYISTMSLIRKESFVKFDDQLMRLQDWDLWLSIAANNGVGVCTSEYMFDTVKRDGISTNDKYKESLDYIVKKHNLNRSAGIK